MKISEKKLMKILDTTLETKRICAASVKDDKEQQKMYSMWLNESTAILEIKKKLQTYFKNKKELKEIENGK
jgi:hypothetical protein